MEFSIREFIWGGLLKMKWRRTLASNYSVRASRISRISIWRIGFDCRLKIQSLLLLTLSGLLSSCSWIYGSIVRTEFNTPRAPGSESCPSTFSGSGSAGDPYLISCETQFKKLGESPSLWSASIALTKDLDLSGVQLSPIGNSSTPFTGKFDGQGFRLKNISMSTDSIEAFGVFGWTRTAEITNLILENISISSSVGTGNVGGLIGYAENQIQVSNVQVSGSVTSIYNSGGIIGRHDDNEGSGNGTGLSLRLSNLTNSASVSGAQEVGGILGEGAGSCGLSTNLNNSGSVSGGTRSGGIAGIMDRIVSGNCSNSGPLQFVSSRNSASIQGYYSGGLFGQTNTPVSTSNPLISRGSNSGNITGTGYSGGLVGHLRGAIADSFSSGNVLGDSFVTTVGGAFGMLGWGSDAHVRRVYSSGNVSGAGSIALGFGLCGGIAGQTAFTNIADSFTTSSVSCFSSSNQVGRVFGSASSMTISNVYFNSVSTCSNPSGSCAAAPAGTTGINHTTNPNYFNTSTNAPLSSWNFTTIWQIGTGTTPSLR
jgi:hypothetical protein